MAIDKYEQVTAAMCLLFDPEISEELGTVLIEMTNSNAYFGVLIQISKYLNDRKTDRLFSAAEFLKKANTSRENKGALRLLLVNLFRKFEPESPRELISRLPEESHIDWSKTNKNILLAIQLLAKEDYEKLKGRSYKLKTKSPD